MWCLARGDSGAVPECARLITADRSRTDAYSEVDGQQFDRVVELSWQPRWVSQAVDALGDSAGHWTHISSVAVYADHEGDVHDESAPLRGALAHDTLASGSQYSEAKVACEHITQRAAGGNVLHVRAGVIAGPGDPTDRFGYWPGRCALAAGGPILVPDTPTFSTQNIDVRDLAQWVTHASQHALDGPVNAVGEAVLFSDMIAQARATAGHTGEVVTATPTWLREHHVKEWSGPYSLPWWYDGPHKYPAIGRHDGSRYAAHGGRHRPYAELMRDVCDDERERGLDRDRSSGLTRDEELALIGEWNQ